MSKITAYQQIEDMAEALKEEILNSVTNMAKSDNEYYVSNDGSDENDGRSPKTPWKTLQHVSNAVLPEGSIIYLKRGDLFREPLTINYNRTTVSAYGVGEKPKLYGSARNYAFEKDWKLTEIKNIYRCEEIFENDIGNIVCDDGEKYGFKQIIGNFGFKGTLLELHEDMQFYHEAKTGELFLYSEEAPWERFSEIEICKPQCLIGIKADNVTIDNICCKYCSSHAVGGTCRRGITVQNCELGWIGGCIQYTRPDGTSVRFGNGVEIYAECFDYDVSHNYIYQVYDAGVTHQYFQDAHKNMFIENVRYCNNLFEYCTYSIEYAMAKQSDSEQHMNNILIEKNIMRFAGYGFGSQRPDKDAAAHIKSWETCNESDNFVIKNNVFDSSDYMLVHVAAYKEEHLPIFNGNTFVQFDGGELGRHGVVPTELVLTDDAQKFFAFDKQAKFILREELTV